MKTKSFLLFFAVILTGLISVSFGIAQAENAMYSDCAAMGVKGNATLEGRCVAKSVCPSNTREVGSTGAFSQCGGSELCCVPTQAIADWQKALDAQGNEATTVTKTAATANGANSDCAKLGSPCTTNDGKSGACGGPGYCDVTKTPDSLAPAGAFPVSSTVGSQCKNGRDGGPQTECVTDTAAVLSQCRQIYSDESECSSVKNYVNTMASQCRAEQPAGIDCAMVAQNGIYGRESDKFANYLNSGGSSNVVPGSGTGNPDVVPGSGAGVGVMPGLYIPGAEIGLPAPPGGIPQILSNFLSWLLSIIGVIALIAFVISGTQYILAAGNEADMKKGKQNLTYSITGIIIVLASFVIIQAINYALEAQSLF